MTQLTILLVESSGPKAGLLAPLVEKVGFKVLHVSDMKELAEVLTSSIPIHLVLGNWTQHGFSGLEMATVVHARSKVPLPMVLYTPWASEQDLETAKSAGISNVLSLPISEIDLYQVLTPILRERYPWAYPSRSIVGDIELDRETHVVTRRGRRIHLTAIDFRLLEIFVRKPGTVLSREDLLQVISPDEKTSIKYVAVQIHRLKAALTVNGNVPPIKTVRGQGYMIVI